MIKVKSNGKGNNTIYSKHIVKSKSRLRDTVSGGNGHPPNIAGWDGCLLSKGSPKKDCDILEG